MRATSFPPSHTPPHISAAIAFPELQRAAIECALAERVPDLRRHAEVSVAEGGFEVLAGASGHRAAHALAEIALTYGAPAPVVEQFLACDARSPERMVALEVGFGEDGGPPTLFHATAAPIAEALVLIAQLPGMAPALPSVRRALAGARMVHALAFLPAGGEVGLRIYCDRGAGAGASADGDGWSTLVALAESSLGRFRGGYFGLPETEGELPEINVYVERI